MLVNQKVEGVKALTSDDTLSKTLGTKYPLGDLEEWVSVSRQLNIFIP